MVDWRSARPAGLLVLIAAASCGDGAAPTIGLHNSRGAPHPVHAIAQAVIDSLTPPGQAPRILSMTTPGEEIVSGQIRQAARFRDTPGLIAAVGPSSSTMGLAVEPIYREAGIPFVNPNGTSRSFDPPGAWTFSLVPDDSVQGRFIADFIADSLKAASVSLFYIAQEYGVGLAAGVAAGIEARGLELTDRALIPEGRDCRQPGEAPYRSPVRAALAEGAPDAVVVAARHFETACIASELRAAEVRVPVVAGDGAFHPLTNEVAGPDAASIFATAFWHPDDPSPTSRDFVARYGAVAGTAPDQGAALTFDAVMLLASAHTEVGPEPSAVRAYLASLGTERPPYDGITGAIAFGDASRRRLLMVRLLDANVVFRSGSK